jgi:hypothetical protein
MNPNWLIGMVILVVFGAGILSGVQGLLIYYGDYATQTDSFSKMAVPHNFTLSQGTAYHALIKVSNCTTKTLAATNYTNYGSVGKFMLKDNVTWKGSHVCVGYSFEQGHLSGIYLTLLGLVLLLGIALVLKHAIKANKGGR